MIGISAGFSDIVQPVKVAAYILSFRFNKKMVLLLSFTIECVFAARKASEAEG